MSPLEKRRRATQATRDRFIGQPFDWRRGLHCVKLWHAHMRNMGRRPPALPRVTSPAAARAALEERGWCSVSGMFDSLMERIPPAKMLLGDVAVVDGDQGFESVLVYLGPRKLLGWLPEGIEAILEADKSGAPLRATRGVVVFDTGLRELKAAWRV